MVFAEGPSSFGSVYSSL